MADAANMSFEALKNHLEEIRSVDLEVESKLKLLGVLDHKAEEEMKRLIDHQQLPYFEFLAKTLRAGKLRNHIKHVYHINFKSFLIITKSLH